MNMETVALIVSIVGTSVGATWLLRSKLSDLESALKTHVADDTAKFEGLTARVIKMERRRR